MALFFFSTGLAFRVVENKYLKYFVAILSIISHNYRLPCRKTLSNVLIKKVYADVLGIKESVLRNTHSALMVDGWMNKPKKVKHLVFTLRNKLCFQTFLTSINMNLKSEFGTVLAELIENAIKYAKERFNTSVISVTTDNDAKIVCGAKLATIDGNSLITTTCSSHSGNLLLQDLVPSTFSERVKNIYSAFKDLNLQTKLTSAPYHGTRLKNWPETRFAFFRDSCQSIKDNLKNLQAISKEKDVALEPSVYYDINDPCFEYELDGVIKTFDPLCRLINYSQDPTATVADACQKWLELSFEDASHQSLLEDSKKSCAAGRLLL